MNKLSARLLMLGIFTTAFIILFGLMFSIFCRRFALPEAHFDKYFSYRSYSRL